MCSLPLPAGGNENRNAMFLTPPGEKKKDAMKFYGHFKFNCEAKSSLDY